MRVVAKLEIRTGRLHDAHQKSCCFSQIGQQLYWSYTGEYLLTRGIQFVAPCPGFYLWSLSFTILSIFLTFFSSSSIHNTCSAHLILPQSFEATPKCLGRRQGLGALEKRIASSPARNRASNPVDSSVTTVIETELGENQPSNS